MKEKTYDLIKTIEEDEEVTDLSEPSDEEENVSLIFIFCLH